MILDIELISDWFRPKSRVLDLGCGDGSLLSSLKQKHSILGYGLEIDPEARERIDFGVRQGEHRRGL